MLKINDIISVKVEKMVFEGKGLAYYNNHTIFVQRGLPGDHIDIVIVNKKKSIFYGNIISFQKRSTYRKDSQCIHFPSCGGCQYIDIDYSSQVNLKTEMLKDAIQHFFPEVLPKLKCVIPAPDYQYYRNKMEFSFSKDNHQIYCGLKKRHSFNTVLPISNCKLQCKQTNIIIKKISDFFTQNPLDIWETRKESGCLKHVAIRHSKKKQIHL